MELCQKICPDVPSRFELSNVFSVADQLESSLPDSLHLYLQPGTQQNDTGASHLERDVRGKWFIGADHLFCFYEWGHLGFFFFFWKIKLNMTLKLTQIYNVKSCCRTLLTEPAQGPTVRTTGLYYRVYCQFATRNQRTTRRCRESSLFSGRFEVTNWFNHSAPTHSAYFNVVNLCLKAIWKRSLKEIQTQLRSIQVCIHTYGIAY